jgi:hypothetical protein
VRRAGDEILSEIAWPGSEVLTVVRAGGLILSVRLLRASRVMRRFTRCPP